MNAKVGRILSIVAALALASAAAARPARAHCDTMDGPGRAHIHEYVPFIHYVEGMYKAASPAGHEHTSPAGAPPHPER
jgi:hypothetical protein